MIKKMITKNKWKLVITSVVILLPIPVGIILWNSLPEQVAIHWGADGTADGFGSKAVAVFLMPVLILAMHWLCVLVTCLDPGNKRQNEKVFGIVLWLLPVLSVIMNGLVYVNALGLDVSVSGVTLMCMGAAFVVIGNYFPKCKQNHTIGIRVIWALEDEENWNKTHRMAGKLWVVGGFLMIIGAFMPEKWLFLVLFGSVFLLVGVPILYSYLYHRRQVKDGKSCDRRKG